MVQKVNGVTALNCALEEQCKAHMVLTENLMTKADLINEGVTTMLSSAKHLHALRFLEQLVSAVNRQSDALANLQTTIVQVVTNKSQIPVEVVKTEMESFQKSAYLIYKLLGGVIATLLVILVFVITGKHLGWISF